MTRTCVRRRRLALIAAVAVAGGAWAGPIQHAHEGSVMRSAASHRYVVREGDSLWSIASRLQRGSDPRALMDAIESVNHVAPGALRPGQSLVVPSI
jgi:Tfp pilus assembly protein FimV